MVTLSLAAVGLLYSTFQAYAIVWATLGSNQGPLTYQVSALTTELVALGALAILPQSPSKIKSYIMNLCRS